MGAYLFIGGPCDGQWRAVQYHTDAPNPYIVLTYRGLFDEPVRTLYYRRRAMVPGWLVPLTFYVSDPVLPPPRGTVLPGYVQGLRPVAEPCGPWQWIDYPPSLTEAVVAFNAERLAR